MMFRRKRLENTYSQTDLENLANSLADKFRDIDKAYRARIEILERRASRAENKVDSLQRVNDNLRDMHRVNTRMLVKTLSLIEHLKINLPENFWEENE